MADKTPVRVVLDASNVATGLAEFQSGDTLALTHGGTGTSLSIGLSGQVLRVNAARDALEFVDPGDIDIIASSDSTGVQVQDDLNVSGTLSVNVIDVNEISSIDSTAITIKDDLMLAGTLRAEDSSTLSIDGAVASGAITSSGVVTATGFTIGSAAIVEAELETIDGITAGTVAASKAVVVDANKDIASFRNVTATGSFIIGSADMNETDLEKLDGITNGTAAANKAVVVDGNKDIATLRNITSNGTVQFGSLSDGTITATAFVDEDDMSSDSATLIPTQQSVKAYVDTEVAGAGTLNIQGDDSTDMEILIGTDRLFFQGGTNVSTSTDSGAQLTISVADAPTFTGAVTAAGFTIGSAAINEAELETIDGVTAGTVAASKAVVVDSNKDVGSFRNITATGATTSGTFVIGSADINEADLEQIDGLTAGTVAASKAVVVDSNKDIGDFRNVTATGSFIIGSADMNETDLEKLDGITNGAGAANKALVLDGSADVASGLRNLTASGTVTATALDITSISSTDSAIVTVQEGLKVEGNIIVGAIESDDSTAVSILDNLNVEGTVQVSGTSVFTGNVTTAGSFVIGSADMNETDLEKLDGITNGTVAASKAVVVDSNKDIGSFRNITATGATTSGTFVIGSADINEADLEQIDGLTAGTVAASKAVVVDSDKDITGFRNVTASGNGEFGGNLQVGGDFTVSGTTTSVNTTNLEIQDALLELNKNNSGGADVDAGIFVQRGSAGNNAVLYWNEGDDSFKAVLSNSAATATSVTDSSFAGLEVGSLTVNAGIGITASSGDVTVANATSNKDLIFTVNDGGSATEVMRLDGDVSAILVASGKELRFADSGEKISGDGTDLTIASGAKINLNATSDIHIPNDVGIVFGGASEKIEGDGTDLVISANNLTIDAAADIILDAAGNDFQFKANGTHILSIINSSSDVVIKPIVDAKDIIFQQRDGTEVARVEDNGTFNVVTSKLAINGTAITSTAAELNALDGITAVVGELNALDLGDTAVGNAIASKAVILDSNKDFTGGRNFTVTGAITGSALDVTSISSTDSAIITVQEGLKVEGNIIVGAIESDDSSAVSVLDNLNVEGSVQVSGTSTLVGNVSTAGTLAVASTSAFTGAITSNAGVVVDNITIDGTEIDLSSGDLTIDVAGDLVIDVDGADVKLEDDGTEFGRLSRVSSDFVIKSMGNNEDLLFKGVDASSTITALTLDMSEAGAATFNSTVTATGFIIGSADINEAELETIDGVTAGTVAASKAVVVDSNKDIASFRNVTATGSFIIGSADMNETDLEKLDGITNGAGAANKALVLDGSADVASGLRNLVASGSVTATSLDVTSISSTDSAIITVQEGLKVEGNIIVGAIESDDSTAVSILDNLNVEGTVQVSGASTFVGDVTTAGSFIIGSASMNETDLEKLDGITNGTVAANKAVVVDGSKDAGSFRNITATGATTSGTFVIGDADIDETDLEKIDGITNGTVAANKAVVVDASKDIGSFRNVTATGAFIIGNANMNETDLEKLDGITNGTAAANKALVADGNIDIDTLRNVGLTGTLTVPTVDVNIIQSTDSSEILVNEAMRVSGTITGTATAAQYSDLAERYETDAPVQLGDIVEIGGEKEITKVDAEVSDTIFGVVSSSEQAGMIMNTDAGDDATHPLVALTGRVKVKVIGSVSKGDRLVTSSTPGVARKALKSECTAFTVVGRALQDKASEAEGLVLCYVQSHA